MISKSEILKGNELPCEYRENYEILYERINKVRKEYGRPLIVTSGFRSKQDHFRIYRNKGIFNPPMGSKHLSCQAIDIYDPKGEFKHFILNNLSFFEDIGFWFEDFFYTTNWVHLQTIPPNSGKRFFIP